MAKFGARYIRFAPFAPTNPEPDGAYPNYGAAISLSKLVKVTDSPNIVEAKHYADDELDEYVSEVTEADVDIEVSDISNEMAAAVLGAKLDEDGDLAYGEDTAPYGGLGFVSSKMVDNKKYFVGIVYPKVKAAVQGEDFDTKGENITFANGKLKFKASKAKIGKWKRVSKQMESVDAAKAWVDQKLQTADGTKKT